MEAVRRWGSVGRKLSSDGGRSIFWGARYKKLWGCSEDEAGTGQQSRGPRGAAKPPALVAHQHEKMEGWRRDGGVLAPQMALGSISRLRPCPSCVGIGSRGMAGRKGGMPGIPKSSGSDDGLSKFDLSNVIANMATGERLTTQEYKKMSTWTVLRVFEDGTKEEMTLSECVEDAEEEGLKVVMVAKAAKPPVVKVMDFGKVMKDKQKKAKEVAKKATAQSIKELRVSLNIGQHDLDVKMRQGTEFLQKGHKVKLFSKLRGADFFHRQEQALKHLRDIAAQMSEHGVIETEPNMNGNVASTLVRPGPPKSKAAGGKADKTGGGAGGESKDKTPAAAAAAAKDDVRDGAMGGPERGRAEDGSTR